MDKIQLKLFYNSQKLLCLSSVLLQTVQGWVFVAVEWQVKYYYYCY